MDHDGWWDVTNAGDGTISQFIHSYTAMIFFLFFFELLPKVERMVFDIYIYRSKVMVDCR